MYKQDLLFQGHQALLPKVYKPIFSPMSRKMYFPKNLQTKNYHYNYMPKYHIIRIFFWTRSSNETICLTRSYM